MQVMIAFGLASIMLTIGLLIRTKVPFVKKMLVPASVVGGIIGLILMNTGIGVLDQIDENIFTSIVSQLFTLSFISIGLTEDKKPAEELNEKKENKIGKNAIVMGSIWNALYAATPVIAFFIFYLFSNQFDIHPMYGMLIQFGFAQGPGQAATFGTIFEETYGFPDAAMVGVTFAVIGFLACFFVGVPLAKLGIRKKLTSGQNSSLNHPYVERGYYIEEKNKPSLGKETIYSGNMDTMTFHFAVMGIAYLLALGISTAISYIPVMGEALSGMIFIYGMIVGYGIKYIMKKLNLDGLLDNTFQSKITGWATDYLVVASFLAVRFSIIGAWIVPIIVASLVVTIVSLSVTYFMVGRIDEDYAFERLLGFYGTTTGTVPSGIALVRIVDPQLSTPTPVELGLMNVPMLLCYITVATIMAIAGGTLSYVQGILLLLLPVPIYVGIWGYGQWKKRSKTKTSTIFAKETSNY